MDRDIPQFNRIIMTKIQQKNMETHYKNLFNIHKSKSKTNTSLIPLSKFNLKAQQIHQQLQTQIEKGNVILFQKMNKIMRRSDPINKKSTNKLKISSNKFAHHIHRINQENQQFLERLCNLKPTINNKKIHEERVKQLSILKLLGRSSIQSLNEKDKIKPIKLSPDEKETKRYGTQSNDSRIKSRIHKTSSLEPFSQSFQLHLNARPLYTQTDEQSDRNLRYSQEYFKKQMKKIESKRNKVQSSIADYQNETRNSKCSKPSSVTSLELQSRNFQEKSIILFTSFKMINYIMYKVFIVRKHKLYQIICAEVNNLSSQMTLQLDEERGKQLLQSIDYNYEIVIESLEAKENQLWMNLDSLTTKKRGTSFLKLKKISNPSHITEQAIENQSPLHNQSLSLQNNCMFVTFQPKQ